MEDAINEAIREGEAGNERHFYDGFKSKEQNAHLAKIQMEAFKSRKPISAKQHQNTNKRYKFLLLIIPLFNYLAVQFFHERRLTLGFISIWLMLISAGFAIWRLYWME